MCSPKSCNFLGVQNKGLHLAPDGTSAKMCRSAKPFAVAQTDAPLHYRLHQTGQPGTSHAVGTRSLLESATLTLLTTECMKLCRGRSSLQPIFSSGRRTSDRCRMAPPKNGIRVRPRCTTINASDLYCRRTPARKDTLLMKHCRGYCICWFVTGWGR